MNDNGRNLLSEQLNSAIVEIEKVEDSFESYKCLSSFMKCSKFYLLALKREAENRNCSSFVFQEYFNSIFRTFFSECIWACKSDIEDMISRPKDEFRYFSELLNFIENQNLLFQTLMEHVDIFWDIYHLRNLAQHHVTVKKIRRLHEKLRDEKLKKLVLLESDYSDVKLHPDLFKEVVIRLKSLIDTLS